MPGIYPPLDCRAVPCYDPAGSVKMIRDQHILDQGCHRQRPGAEIYQMEIHCPRIQDNPEYFTRFFVLSRTPAAETVRQYFRDLGLKQTRHAGRGLKAFADAVST
jgi:prephenate dehydratase